MGTPSRLYELRRPRGQPAWLVGWPLDSIQVGGTFRRPAGEHAGDSGPNLQHKYLLFRRADDDASSTASAPLIEEAAQSAGDIPGTAATHKPEKEAIWETMARDGSHLGTKERGDRKNAEVEAASGRSFRRAGRGGIRALRCASAWWQYPSRANADGQQERSDSHGAGRESWRHCRAAGNRCRSSLSGRWRRLPGLIAIA